jgi:hypothetical protein
MYAGSCQNWDTYSNSGLDCNKWYPALRDTLECLVAQGLDAKMHVDCNKLGAFDSVVKCLTLQGKSLALDIHCDKYSTMKKKITCMLQQTDNGYTCRHDPGELEQFCTCREEDVACKNNGTATGFRSNCKCDCTAGFSGQLCENAIDCNTATQDVTGAKACVRAQGAGGFTCKKYATSGRGWCAHWESFPLSGLDCNKWFASPDKASACLEGQGFDAAMVIDCAKYKAVSDAASCHMHQLMNRR